MICKICKIEFMCNNQEQEFCMDCESHPRKEIILASQEQPKAVNNADKLADEICKFYKVDSAHVGEKNHEISKKYWIERINLLSSKEAVVESSVVLKPLDTRKIAMEIFANLFWNWRRDDVEDAKQTVDKIESILKEYGTSPSTCCRCWKGFAEDDVCCECIKNMWIVEHRNHVLDEAIEAIRKAKEVAKEQIDEITTEMIQKKAKKLLNM